MSSRQPTRQRGIKINVLHESPVLAAVAEEVREVLVGNVALLLGLADFALALAQVFDVLCKAGLQVTRWDAEDAADFRRDAVGVGVDIVHFVKAGGKLARETRGESGRDRREHVCSSQCGWKLS